MKILRKSIKLTIKIAISQSGITPLLRSFLRLRRLLRSRWGDPPATASVQLLTDPANDLLHARLPCPAPGQWAVQLQECHEDQLHLPHAGVGPNQLDHVWFTGLHDVFRPQLPGPLTHRLIHPVRRKKASKRTRQSTTGDVYVVGGYREDGWDPANPGQSMPFVPLAALLFLLGDVFEGYGQQEDPASVPVLTPHAGGGINP